MKLTETVITLVGMGERAVVYGTESTEAVDGLGKGVATPANDAKLPRSLVHCHRYLGKPAGEVFAWVDHANTDETPSCLGHVLPTKLEIQYRQQSAN